MNADAVATADEPGPAVYERVRAIRARRHGHGLKIVVDAKIATVYLGTALTGGTQDQIYVVAAEECHLLWEDPNAPMFIRARSSRKPPRWASCSSPTATSRTRTRGTPTGPSS